MGGKTNSEIGRNVRAELARRGQTQTDLGDVLGISRVAVGQRILGNVAFKADELQLTADYLDVSIATLYDVDPRLPEERAS